MSQRRPKERVRGIYIRLQLVVQALPLSGPQALLHLRVIHMSHHLSTF